MSGTLEFEIIWKVRRLFRALETKSNEILKPFGLSAAERAVLEFLYPDQAMTVPQIARRFQVSRQHIQVTANALLEKGYLLQEDNPDHARSPLSGLTEKGRAACAAIQETEKDIIDQEFSGIPQAEKVVTARMLGTLLNKLQNDS